MKEISYRRGVKGEGLRVAELILMAWPVEEFLASVPDSTYEDLHMIVAQLVDSEDNIYSYQNMVVAVDVESGQPVGALCGYDGAKYKTLKAKALKALGMSLDSAFGRVQEALPEQFYLDSVGVDSNYRGHGIASQLFKEQIAFAKTSGASEVGLIVDFDKEKARALYEHLGFQVSGEMDFMGHPMHRMTYFF